MCFWVCVCAQVCVCVLDWMQSQPRPHGWPLGSDTHRGGAETVMGWRINKWDDVWMDRSAALSHLWLISLYWKTHRLVSDSWREAFSLLDVSLQCELEKICTCHRWHLCLRTRALPALDCQYGKVIKTDDYQDSDKWREEGKGAQHRDLSFTSFCPLFPPLLFMPCLSPRGHPGGYSEERRSDHRGWQWKGRTNQKAKRRGKGPHVAERVSCRDEVTPEFAGTGYQFWAFLNESRVSWWPFLKRCRKSSDELNSLWPVFDFSASAGRPVILLLIAPAAGGLYKISVRLRWRWPHSAVL